MYSPAKNLQLVVQKTVGGMTFSCLKDCHRVVSLDLGLLLSDECWSFDGKVLPDVVCYRHGGVYNEYLLTVADAGWKVRIRLYNDALAFRYEGNRKAEAHVLQELSSWTVAPESSIWYFERRNAWKLKSYAGLWEHCKLRDLYHIASSPTQGTPVMFRLPTGEYGFISEAALADYSGLRLKVDTLHTFKADFTEGEKGFQVPARFQSPWRVFYVADDLNALVNQSVIRDLSPEPDKTLFSDRSYIKAGKCAWRWFSKGTGNPAQECKVIDAASELHFLYSLVDDGWKKWPDCWKEAEKLVKYAKKKQVGLFFWQHSGPILDEKDDYAAMRNFLDSVADIGASGIKVDFMDSEAKSLIDFELRLLKECAKRSILVNFHGCQKPSGETFTYPNELTREGIRGMELNKMRAAQSYLTKFQSVV